MLLSEREQRNLSEMSFNENDILKDILEESELKMNSDYPNEAYGDLILLVIKHKISNVTSNTIIKFFNKHTNGSFAIVTREIQKK